MKNLRFIAALFLITISTLARAQQTRGLRIVVKDEKGKVVTSYQDSYALVVGVSDYTAGWPDLENAVRDALDVRDILTHYGFEVTVVENPTKEELQKAMEDFIFQFGIFPDNRLVFYFAGHGYTVNMAYGGRLGYIVPADAPLPYRDASAFMRGAVSMQDFENQSRQIQSKHVLYVFDSCFSGSIFALSRSIPSEISEKLNRPVRQFITAGSEEEEVSDQSIFTRQFIEALKGEGDLSSDGYITGTELGLYLQNTVEEYSRSTQHPQYGKIRDPNLDKGDFVFVMSEIKSIPELFGTDDTSPVILNSTPETAGEGEPFEIVAHVSDDASGVSTVRLAYKSGGVSWNTVEMARKSGDAFGFLIPKEQIQGPAIHYYFGAVDRAGNKNTLLAPNGQALKTQVTRKKKGPKWFWYALPAAAVLGTAGYFAYQQMPGNVRISIQSQ